jgi:hypothetical protein
MNIKNKKKGYGFDIVNAINSITPENIEFHLRSPTGSYNFCGPNTNLNKRLINYKKNGEHDGIQEWSKPINALDNACYHHDISYSKYKDLNERLKADKMLLKKAQEVLDNPNSTLSEKHNASIVKIVMKGKTTLGIGYNLQIGQGLDNVNQLISDAQKQAQNSNFNSQTPASARIIGSLIPLIILAGSFGIGKLVKHINKKKKENGEL